MSLLGNIAGMAVGALGAALTPFAGPLGPALGAVGSAAVTAWIDGDTEQGAGVTNPPYGSIGAASPAGVPSAPAGAPPEAPKPPKPGAFVGPPKPGAAPKEDKPPKHKRKGGGKGKGGGGTLALLVLGGLAMG